MLRKHTADRIRDVRRILRQDFSYDYQVESIRSSFENTMEKIAILNFIVKITFAVTLLNILYFALIDKAHAYTISENTAVKAIIGEAEGEKYLGKVAIGEALRNRNYTRGVYGLHSKRVVMASYSHKTLYSAIKAWHQSRFTDLTHGAQFWGNANDLRKFKHASWFNHAVFTAKIYNHYFFRIV